MGRQFYSRAYVEQHGAVVPTVAAAAVPVVPMVPVVPVEQENTNTITDKKPVKSKTRNKTKSKSETTKPIGKLVASTPEFVPTEQVVQPGETATVRAKSRKPLAKPKPKLAGKDARVSEIEQLRLRFTDLQVEELGDTMAVTLNLPITDPDFPYDLPSVHLRVQLPPGYPNATPQFTVLNDAIPADIKRRLDSRMNDTVRTVPVGQLSVRPMLRYLEHNLEAIVAAKTAIKFIPHTAIRVSPSLSGGCFDSGGDGGGGGAVCKVSPEAVNRQQRPENKQQPLEGIKLRECRFEPGIFIKLQEQKELGGGSYSLHIIQQDRQEQNYGLLTLSSLSLTVVCQKCAAMTDITNIRIESERLHNCSRCKREVSVQFYPQYMTMDTDTVGQCRFLRCKPVDLLPSQWQLECPQCDQNVNGESGVRVSAVHFGERVVYPCRRCGCVMAFGVDGCRWTERATLGTPGGKQAKSEKVAVTIGEPLLKYGACQHYAKSFRWYRFPCCGRVFPCDRCHEEHQGDHQMEWATRFLCGWCSREQHINNVNKVCVCGVDPTKRHTAHWEGGKGMRERVTMSKKDNKKYRGLNKQ